MTVQRKRMDGHPDHARMDRACLETLDTIQTGAVFIFNAGQFLSSLGSYRH